MVASLMYAADDTHGNCGGVLTVGIIRVIARIMPMMPMASMTTKR